MIFKIWFQDDQGEASRGDKNYPYRSQLFRKCGHQNNLFVPVIGFEASGLTDTRQNKIAQRKKWGWEFHDLWHGKQLFSSWTDTVLYNCKSIHLKVNLTN